MSVALGWSYTRRVFLFCFFNIFILRVFVHIFDGYWQGWDKGWAGREAAQGAVVRRAPLHLPTADTESTPGLCNYLLFARKQAIGQRWSEHFRATMDSRCKGGWEWAHSTACISSTIGGAVPHPCSGHWMNLSRYWLLGSNWRSFSTVVTRKFKGEGWN